MNKMILGILLCFGIILFAFSLRKQPIKNWLLTFFMSSYFAHIIGAFVADQHLIRYPVTLFDNYFTSSFLYEAVLFPVINVYFYQTTYHSGLPGIFVQSTLYTTVLTIIEVIIRKYTNLIVYISWDWYITFITTFCFLIANRMLLQFINRFSK